MWPFDQNNQQMYQQYAQGYQTGNYSGIDNNQVWGNLLQFMRGAPSDMQQRIYQQHFEQMPFEQRTLLAQQMPQGYYMDPNDTWSMAQSFHRLGQEQPNMIQRVMSHPLLTGAALGLVGLVAKHAIDHHRQNEYQQQPQYGYQQPPQYGNQGFQQDPYGQQQEIQELRRELHHEERREERLEEREHHHRRDEW